MLSMLVLKYMKKSGEETERFMAFSDVKRIFTSSILASSFPFFLWKRCCSIIHLLLHMKKKRGNSYENGAEFFLDFL